VADMNTLIFTFMAVPIVIWDAFSLFKNRERKILVFYSLTIIIVYAIILLDTLHVKVPSPAEFISNLIKLIFPNVGAE
jgi:hypothetical protein